MKFITLECYSLELLNAHKLIIVETWIFVFKLSHENLKDQKNSGLAVSLIFSIQLL